MAQWEIDFFNFDSSSSFRLRLDLIKIMLGKKKLFEVNDFSRIPEICTVIAGSLEKDGNFAGVDFCQEALEIYRILGDEGKIELLEKKYQELKGSYKFASYGGEIDLTDTINRHRKLSKELAEGSPEEIIGFLMQSKEMFDPDDLLFFRFLLVEQAGCNLRHRIAHSLMFYSDYHINNMHLLIIALLRIGRFDFVSSRNEEEAAKKDTDIENKQ